MSVHDSWEVKRGPVWRRKARRYPISPKRAKKEAQLAMELYGGSSAPKQEREPFDDSIDEIGR